MYKVHNLCDNRLHLYNKQTETNTHKKEKINKEKEMRELEEYAKELRVYNVLMQYIDILGGL